MRRRLLVRLHVDVRVPRPLRRVEGRRRYRRRGCRAGERREGAGVLHGRVTTVPGEELPDCGGGSSVTVGKCFVVASDSTIPDAREMIVPQL